MFNYKRTLATEWYLPSPKWMFLINAILLLLHVSVAKTLDPILWDKHLFQRNGPGGFRIVAEINDVIDIICPQSNETLSDASAQYHKFTQVSRRGYENCDLRDGGSKTLLRCNRPFVENRLTLLFQDQTAYPGDPVFKNGRDYYFITTADGTEEGIDQISGGLCQSHYMKLIVHMNGEGVTGFPSTPSLEGGRPTSRPTSSLPIRSPTQTSPTESTKITTSTVKPTKRKNPSKTPKNTGKNDEYKGDNGDNGSSHQSSSSVLLLICSSIAFVRWLRH